MACALLAAAGAGYYLYVRVLRTNFHEVVPGKVYRSAQPSPGQIHEWKQEYDLKTVVNLRGESSREFHEEEEQAVREAGMKHVDIRLSAVRLPTRPWLMKLIDVLETGEKPMLLHCRDGADRTGLASVLAAMAVGGQTYRQAREQFSWKYLQLNRSPDRIAGLLQKYEQFAAHNGGTAGWNEFRHWAKQHYRPYYFYVEIKAPQELTAQPGQDIRFEVTIVNRSGELLPASDTDKEFNVVAFLGSSRDDSPEKILGHRVQLPYKDLPDGQSVTLDYELTAPTRPGEYKVHMDMIEERRTWFARQGSPVPTIHLTVTQPADGGSQ